MKNVSESLAGRVGIIKLLGLSLAEEKDIPFEKSPWIPQKTEIKTHYLPINVLQIFNGIIRGSFPRLLHRNAPPLDSYYGSYVQTYIDRDLRDFIKVSSLSSFEKFIKVCAARTASILSLSDLARDSDVSVNTAKEWLGMLEASGQIFLLRPYYKNITKRLIKAPKLYFLDTGLVCYLTGWRKADITVKGAFAGALFETFVVAEILKSYLHRGIEPPIFYFRTKEKVEVDLLIERNGKLFPVEIKLSSTVRLTDVKNLLYLEKLGLPLGPGAVITPAREIYPLSKNFLVVPVSTII
jgi:predicted AAA+ superfamily ATPase